MFKLTDYGRPVMAIFSNISMEDGGVDTTVLDSRQHKVGWMADFPTLLASLKSYFLLESRNPLKFN